jgi:glycine/D-amino acid oxidase-like deaminating enzyme
LTIKQNNQLVMQSCNQFNLSFWETQSFTECDYLIVGGGIVGLSAAASLLETEPGASVVVVERGLFPTGASTKNAGFACFGSLTELLADLATTPPDQVVALVERRWRGLHQLRQRLGDAAIGYEPLGGHELLTDRELPALAHLDQMNDLLRPLFAQPVYHLRNDLLPKFGFDQKTIKALVMNPLEGQIDTGQMMRSLWAHAQQLGARLLTGCAVQALAPEGQRVGVRVRDPLTGEGVHLLARRVGVCTNAFTNHLVPGLDLAPGRGQVLVTAPVPGLRFRGAFHLDEGYFYFRNVGDRVLLGGGRNLDFAGETTTELAVTGPVMARLEQLLREVILPGQPVAVAQRWAGIMAFGATKSPLVQPWNQLPQVVLGVRMGGMGVALGTQTGAEVAALMRQA